MNNSHSLNMDMVISWFTCDERWAAGMVSEKGQGWASHLQRACNFFGSETRREGTCGDASLWNQEDMALMKRPSMCKVNEFEVRSETIGARWC